jgi:hypothetical protein
MPRLIPLALFTFLVGCGSTIFRGDIFPPAQSRPPGAPVYAQARQYGRSLPLWRLRDRSNGIGLTLDVENRSPSAMVLRLSQAHLARQLPSGPRRPAARITAAGTGQLPSSLPSSHTQPVDIALQPGQQATLWVLFEATHDEADGQPWDREMVVLPLSSGQELILQLTDPANAPAFRPEGARFGLSLMAGAHAFTPSVSHRLDVNAIPYVAGLWYRRDTVKTTLFVGGLDLFETVGDVTVKEKAFRLALDVAWVPSLSHFGAYAAAGLVLGDLERTSWAGDDPRFSGEVGLIVSPATVSGIPLAFRLGYTRMFDVSAARNGVYIGLELPLTWL